MAREIVINATKHESRIAVLDDGQVVELWVERTRHRTLVGNIYKGRVTKVLPGMQSAFVELGLERDAFLYVSDVVEDFEEYETESRDDLTLDEAPRGEASISDLLREGQEIVVQVSKDTIAGKGARITSHITLPGRYLVFMPTVNHIGVSRRIENEDERTRLKQLLETIRPPGSGGEALDSCAIFERDIGWLAEADVLVAEVSTPSTGVGYEIATARYRFQIPVICLYRPAYTKRCTAMVSGDVGIELLEYREGDLDGLLEQLRTALRKVSN